MNKRLVWSASTSIHGVRVHRIPETNEWVASLWVAGKHQVAADCFECSKEDAINTAKSMDRQYCNVHGGFTATGHMDDDPVDAAMTLEGLTAAIEDDGAQAEAKGAGKPSAWDFAYYAARRVYPTGTDEQHQLMADFTVSTQGE